MQTESLQVVADTWATGRLFDKFEREAHVRPRRHQPVPNQYRTWWGHGPEVRGKGGCGFVVGRGEKIYSLLLPKPLLGGTSCWDDRPPKRGNLRGNRWVHALSVRREEINIVAGKVAARRRTKWVCDAQKDKMNPPLSGRGFVRLAGTPKPDKGG